MLQRPDVPTLGRVMRVIPRAGEMPAPGFTWEDYEDVAAGNLTANDADGEDEAEGGWGIVKGKGRSRKIFSLSRFSHFSSHKFREPWNDVNTGATSH